MAYGLIASTVDADNGGANSTTTPSIDTTGATLLVIAGAVWRGLTTTAPTFSDSAGNTWSVTTWGDNGVFETQLAYVYNPTTSASHTATVAGTNQYPGVVFAAFSGAAASPLDQQSNVVAANQSTAQPGSITPAEDNELLFLAGSTDNPQTSVSSIGDSFTQLQFKVKNNTVGIVAAYQIQTTATARNPLITFNASGICDAHLASFKAASGGGGGGVVGPLLRGRLVTRGILQGRLVG